MVGSTTCVSVMSTFRPTRANTRRIRYSASQQGFSPDYVAEKSGRLGIPVALETLRAGQLAKVLAEAPAGAVVLPDVVNTADISAIAHAVDVVTAEGRRVVVRCAAPLAAELAGVPSSGLLATPLVERSERVLLVCGSHTQGASAQLAPIAEAWVRLPLSTPRRPSMPPPRPASTPPPPLAGLRREAGDVLLATERDRAAEHNTLVHGERVMAALTTAVRSLLPEVGVVVAKGGITSAEVANTGIGATSAFVLGQVLPGVSVWRLSAHDGRELLFVVVPGNVGGPDTLARVLDALDVRVPVS